MSNAVVIALSRPKPVDRVVEELEKLLEQAKSGELRVICYCGVLTERRVFHGTVEEDDGIQDFPAVMFSLDRLRARLIRSYEERVEDAEL